MLGEFYVLSWPHLTSSFAKWDNVVSAHEGDCAFGLDGLEVGVSGIFVRGELVIPDVAGSFVVDHFECPDFVLFEAVDFDGEGEAVDDDVLAFSRCDQVWFVFDHRWRSVVVVF